MRLFFLKAMVLSGVAAAAPTLAGYADLADLTLASPIVVRATIAGTERITDRDSPGLAPGRARLLVKVGVDAALLAPGAIPAALNYLWDAPLDARGRPPKPKGQPVLLFLAEAAADGKARLVAGSGQRSWSADDEATVRAIAAEARTRAVPVVTGIDNGFRAAGTVPGESESQFFLTTADGRGITMIVTERPGVPRRVAVARGDIIDESAAPVQRDTLLWYRLACGLPAALPPKAAADPALAADYAAALASLGPCGRTR